MCLTSSLARLLPPLLYCSAAGTLNSVTVQVADYSEDYPQLEDDESYTLDIPSSGAAAITAKTVYGALHALETLSHVIVFNFNASSYEMSWVCWLGPGFGSVCCNAPQIGPAPPYPVLHARCPA